MSGEECTVGLPRVPDDDHSLVIRTDFSDDAAWDAVRQRLLSGAGEDFALGLLEFIDDRAYDNITVDAIVALAIEDDPSFVFLADRETMTGEERTLVAVDLWHERGRWFRLAPSEVAPVQNNLSIANMDFAEFADSVDDDGVFRGHFPEVPAPASTEPSPNRTAITRSFVLVQVGCWIFAILGVAMVASPTSTGDVVTGVLAVVFFGGGAVVGLMTRRRA